MGEQRGGGGAGADLVAGPINRVQRIGAQAIVGTFVTVATWVAEAEAHIPSAQERFWKRAVKLWTDIHALPDTNPLRRNTSRMRKFRRQYRSPLYEVAETLKDIEMEQTETIRPCILAPWEKRVQVATEDAAQRLEANWAVRIAISSSSRNGIVGMGGAIRVQNDETQSFSATLGKREEQNPYLAELAAIAEALSRLPKLRFRNIALTTRQSSYAHTEKTPATVRSKPNQPIVQGRADAKKRGQHGDSAVAACKRRVRARTPRQAGSKDVDKTKRYAADTAC